MQSPAPSAIARDIVIRLQRAGHEAFWVGGCVRDRFLGLEPKDYDVATSAVPAEIDSARMTTARMI